VGLVVPVDFFDRPATIPAEEVAWAFYGANHGDSRGSVRCWSQTILAGKAVVEHKVVGFIQELLEADARRVDQHGPVDGELATPPVPAGGTVRHRRKPRESRMFVSWHEALTKKQSTYNSMPETCRFPVLWNCSTWWDSPGTVSRDQLTSTFSVRSFGFKRHSRNSAISTFRRTQRVDGRRPRLGMGGAGRCRFQVGTRWGRSQAPRGWGQVALRFERVDQADACALHAPGVPGDEEELVGQRGPRPRTAAVGGSP